MTRNADRISGKTDPGLFRAIPIQFPCDVYLCYTWHCDLRDFAVVLHPQLYHGVTFLLRILPLLLLDAIWVTVMKPTGQYRRDRKGRLRAVKVRRKVPVLVALGVWAKSGNRVVLDWELAEKEAQPDWEHLRLTRRLSRARPGTDRPRWRPGPDGSLDADLSPCALTLKRDLADTLAFSDLLQRFLAWRPQTLRTTSLLERVNRKLRLLFRSAAACHSDLSLLAATARVLSPHLAV
jgi:hypothetical protein